MAANPQYPPQPERPRDIHPKLQIPPRKAFPWVLLAIIIAAAILIVVLVALLPKAPIKRPAPNAAEVPQQPTAAQIQLSNLNITPAPTGGALLIDGRIFNSGNTQINGVQVQATFKSANGQNLETQTRPVQGMAGGSMTQTEDLTKAPIRPNESRPIRIYFEHPPAGWNQQMPEITVTTVTGAGRAG
jgi:Protein of unknown function (DUF2393)/Protein of unknown function (DUF3426)